MTKYGMSILHLGDPLRSTWINEKTGELVTVDGRECPEGCRVPDREEVDKIFRNCYVPGGDYTGWKPFKPF
jgi:hypothetical protein